MTVIDCDPTQDFDDDFLSLCHSCPDEAALETVPSPVSPTAPRTTPGSAVCPVQYIAFPIPGESGVWAILTPGLVSKTYEVDATQHTCTCKAFRYGRTPTCKHLDNLEAIIRNTFELKLQRSTDTDFADWRGMYVEEAQQIRTAWLQTQTVLKAYQAARQDKATRGHRLEEAA